MRRYCWQTCVRFAAGLVFIAGSSVLRADETKKTAYERNVVPFLTKHCLKCHGPEKQNGKLRLDGPKPNFQIVDQIRTWENVRKQLASGAMPPEGRPEPQAAELSDVLDWITAELAKATIANRGGRRTLRRLTRDEYSNTLKDLLGIDFVGIDIVFGDKLPPEGLGASFKNDADALSIQPLHLQRFLESAESVLRYAIVGGDQPAVYRYELDLATLRPALNPKAKDGPIDYYHADGLDPISKTTMKAKAVRPEFIKGIGVAIDPTYLRTNLPGNDGSQQLLLTLPIVAPSSGVIRVRIRASARIPDGEGEPILRVGLYYHDNNFVNIPLGTTVVGTPPTKPGEFVFDIPIDFVDGTWDVVRRHKAIHLKFENAYVPLTDRVRDKNAKKGWPWQEPKLILHAVSVETPNHAKWPPPHQAALFDAPPSVKDDAERARIVLKRFMDRAYRRPVKAEEVERMAILFDRTRKSGGDFASALRIPLTAILCSPHFLCMIETRGPQLGRVNDHELATRLSYFLWNTMPDEELRRLADAGKLSDPVNLQQQTERLLKSPRSMAFVRSFTAQWLGLDHIEHGKVLFADVLGTLESSSLAQERDRLIKDSLAHEPIHFLQNAIDGDRPIASLVSADFVMIDARLADFYGIRGVAGVGFRKVTAPAERRGGLLTMAGVIAAASDGNDKSVVQRGVYVMGRLLDLEVGTPPANVVPLLQQAKKDNTFAKLTIREQLKKHTEVQSCAVCHNRIDPLGYFWNGYDLSGRTTFFGKKSTPTRDDNTSGRLPDRTAFASFDELREILAEPKRSKHYFGGVVTRKLLAYALGRSLDFNDQGQIARLEDRLSKGPVGLRSLIHEIVRSDAFLSK